MDRLAKRWQRMIVDLVFGADKVFLCGCDEHGDTFTDTKSAERDLKNSVETNLLCKYFLQTVQLVHNFHG